MTQEEFDESFSLFPLEEVLKTTSSTKAKKLLKTFQCSKNIDLQDFLYNKAITFEKHFRARTYLYISNDTQEVAAYFTIAISVLFTDGISEDVVLLLDGYKKETKTIPCFLIGQLGKSDKFASKKIGEYILSEAVSIIDDSQSALGGRFILLDAINEKKLIKFYEDNAFFPIEDNPESDSIKMIKPYFDS